LGPRGQSEGQSENGGLIKYLITIIFNSPASGSSIAPPLKTEANPRPWSLTEYNPANR